MLNQISSNQVLNVRAMHTKSINGKAFLIAGDIAGDKAQLSILVRELSRMGYGVLIFDMPSEGHTDGTVPFGYKSDSEFLAHYFYNTYVAYTQLENISVENLHIVGFGESARAILQTGSLGLYLSQQTDSMAMPIDLTLVATDINLTKRIDFDVLNYRDDEKIEWLQNLNSKRPGIPVHLIASNIDRISPIADNQKLLEKLESPPGVEIEGNANNTESQNNINNLITVSLLPHNSLMRSVNVASAIIQATVDPYYTPPGALYLRTLFQYLSMMLFSLICYFVGKLLYRQSYTAPLPERKRAPGIIQAKLLMNLLGIIVDVLIVLSLYAAPISFPYYSVFFIVCLSGFGIVMIFLYRFTDFANNLGSSVILKDANAPVQLCALVFACFIGLVWAMMSSFPCQAASFLTKPMWAILLVALFMPLMYIDEKERRLFADEPKLCSMLFLSNFIMILLTPLFSAAIGLFDTSFHAIYIIFCVFIALSSEYVSRPLGLSSFATALIKSSILAIIAFSDLTLFF